MSSGTVKSKVVEINNEQAFTPDPMFKLMGIFEDSDAGVRAAEDLKDAGFDAADIELFCGVRGAEAYDFTGDEHGLVTKFMRKFRSITYDRIIMERYQTALRDGHCVLMVHIHKTPRRDEAAGVMHHHGAVQVDHFGLTMTRTFSETDVSDETKFDPDETF